ncbi:MAG: hypothetical protein CM1200mP36_07260 [Gammaproteobacteria bacterium]|nr:MAG: hypothetical protein CM1200mP36_07260 [Gammaproteobacteria bacterium]
MRSEGRQHAVKDRALGEQRVEQQQVRALADLDNVGVGYVEISYFHRPSFRQYQHPGRTSFLRYSHQLGAINLIRGTER